MESTLRPSTELQRRIDADVRTSLRRFGTPGAVIAAVKDGHIIYTKSYGLRDRARNLPVLIDTPFEIGSITKQFTAAAILQLQEAGKLNIDSTVATYLSTVPHASEITLRQLLSHTSGLHDYFDAPTIDDDAVKTVTFDQLMARVADLPLDFAPGAKWSYSNTGYAMLGRIIEVTSHETYRDYVKSHLIDPVGMTHTFTVADEPKISGMSVGYRHSAGRLEAAPTISESFGWAAGNIVSTVSDLNKWNKALREGQAISKADYALMATSVSTLQGDAGYGLGLFVGEIEGEPRVGHTGGSFGFTTANEYFPKLDLQIIAFTNLGDDAPEPGEILTQIVLEDLNPNIAAAAARASPGADPAVTELVKMVFVGLQSGDEDYGSFNARLGDKLKAGLAQRLAKGFASYGPPTSAIFKGARTSIDLKWSDYLLQFGPGCSLKFSVALDAEGKVAGISFG
jgi:CubicO group peptidase (beta-lactamase class C family)